METSVFHTKTALREKFVFPFNPERLRSEGFHLQCEVMFGSPSSNCDGNGICRIVAKSQNPLQTFKRTDCSHAKALFTTWNGDKSVALLFRREWLCSNLMRRHFRHGILEMPEPCPIPRGIVASLGLKISELPAGLHLIEDYEKHFRITFRHNDLI